MSIDIIDISLVTSLADMLNAVTDRLMIIIHSLISPVRFVEVLKYNVYVMPHSIN